MKNNKENVATYVERMDVTLHKVLHKIVTYNVSNTFDTKSEDLLRLLPRLLMTTRRNLP